MLLNRHSCSRGNRVISKFVLPLLAVLALGFALLYVRSAHTDSGPYEPFRPPIEKPPGTTLAGSGIVEPVTQNIAVGSPLSGIVTWAIGLDQVGKSVTAGSVLFQLDDRQHWAEWEVRKAALALAQAQLDRLKQMPRPEEVPPLEAKLRTARALWREQQDQHARTQRLYERKALGEEEYLRSHYTLQAAQERLHQAEADLQLVKVGAWECDLRMSAAQVQHAAAQVRQAETELERLKVRAPLDGKLLQVNVRPGEFVSAQAGQTLVLLGNVETLHVRVSLDEQDAPRFRPSSSATAYLRGQPHVGYPLEFVRVEPYLVPKKSLTGDNSERVDTRVLQVIYKIQTKPDLPLIYVGQQMEVFIGQKPASTPGTLRAVPLVLTRIPNRSQNHAPTHP
jgi:multidrug efflux pump subunit AcrA (membrane-fusion protein)